MSALGAAAALASLLGSASAGIPRIPAPAPTELAERSATILDQVASASRPESRDVHSAVDRLDGVVSDVAGRFGENSIESVQAATEAGIALIRDWERFDLAHRYIQRSLALSRVVFGTDHRETAFALQDLAVVRHELRPELLIHWSGPLAREAIAVRTRVLGKDHLETAGSERYLATWLFGSWRTQRRASARSPVLVESQELAGHALGILEAAYGVGHGEVVGLRYLQVQIVLAMQAYALAETLAGDLVMKYEVPCNAVNGEPHARDLLAKALRAQSRVVEAEEFMGAAGADACAVRD